VFSFVGGVVFVLSRLSIECPSPAAEILRNKKQSLGEKPTGYFLTLLYVSILKKLKMYTDGH